jgi:hypothetical protein
MFAHASVEIAPNSKANDVKQQHLLIFDARTIITHVHVVIELPSLTISRTF